MVLRVMERDRAGSCRRDTALGVAIEQSLVERLGIAGEPLHVPRRRVERMRRGEGPVRLRREMGRHRRLR